jgi:uncharacterized protein YgiM (DUF1202 family)
MKTTYWWMLAVSAGLAIPAAWADDQPAAPTPAAPDSKKPAVPTRKTADKPAPAPAPADPITGPGPAVVSQKNVNVRGKAAVNSEVVTRLTRGDRVTVLEEVTLTKHKQDEPAKWAKIALPTNAAVWAHSSFLDQTNNTVKASRLNLRTGPSENHSVIGRLAKGATVKPIDQKGEWVKLEPPADAYGYVAAHLLSRDTGAPTLAANATPGSVPPPIETAVPANPTPAPAEDPTVAATTAAPPTPPPIDKPAVEPPPAAVPDELVKRVVTREGIVERSVSIQAPTHFILQSLDTRKPINFLFSPATNVMLKDYRGQRIVVTGEEMLDERWPNTPVIEVDKIEAVP